MNRFMNKRKTAPTQGSWSATTDYLFESYTMDGGLIATNGVLYGQINGYDLTCNNVPPDAGANIESAVSGAISFDDGENTDYFKSATGAIFQPNKADTCWIICARTLCLSSGHDATTGVWALQNAGNSKGMDLYQLGVGKYRARHKAGTVVTGTGSSAVSYLDDTFHTCIVMHVPGVGMWMSTDGNVHSASGEYSFDSLAGQTPSTETSGCFFAVGTQYAETYYAEAMSIGRMELYYMDNGSVPNFRNIAIWKNAHWDTYIPKALLK